MENSKEVEPTNTSEIEKVKKTRFIHVETFLKIDKSIQTAIDEKKLKFSEHDDKKKWCSCKKCIVRDLAILNSK